MRGIQSPHYDPVQAELNGPGIVAPALLFALIHLTSQKGNSANFAQTEFSEVRPRSSPLAVLRSWCSGIGISRGAPLSEFGARRFSRQSHPFFPEPRKGSSYRHPAHPNSAHVYAEPQYVVLTSR